MHVNYSKRYYDNYPEEYIRNYCANPEVSEHESSKWGNYSAPVQDIDFLSFIKYEMLDLLKWHFFKNIKLTHDHHYVNFHMDDPGSHLEVHNDLKDFRWLITSQVYLDKSDQGVIILDKKLNYVEQVPNNVNTAYAICADPFSWHYVPELKKLKRSILFRVGKRRHRTLAHPTKYKPGTVIINDNHDDTHYAKLGHRMGNLTEAWAYRLGHRNIYHTGWRSKDKDKIINLARKNHDNVDIFFSGELKDLGDITITNKSYNDIADVVFRKQQHNIITPAENYLFEYYKKQLHMNYVDLW